MQKLTNSLMKRWIYIIISCYLSNILTCKNNESYQRPKRWKFHFEGLNVSISFEGPLRIKGNTEKETVSLRNKYVTTRQPIQIV